MKVLVSVNVEILVEVEDGLTLDEAKQIALFNCDSITSGINSKLNQKLIEIEIEDYTVKSVDEV